MADTKISALPASTTPLAGTEVLPIVQSGATRQVSVANLTTGRALSATQLTLTTGNLIVASGQGIDFSANPNPPGMTSELLNDYEEGTWTPSIGGTATYGANTKGWYTKVGRLVVAQADVEITLIGTGSTTALSGLPFAANASAPQASGSIALFNGIAINVYDLAPYVPEGNAAAYFRAQTALDTSNIGNAAIFGNACRVQLMLAYFV